MPTALAGADLYAAYARQLLDAASSEDALGHLSGGNDSRIALPGTALSVFDSANAGLAGSLRNSNGLWYNRKTGFVAEVVVNAGKAIVVFRSVNPDDAAFWAALGAATQSETPPPVEFIADTGGEAEIADALQLTRAAIAQFGAANVVVAGDARGGGLADVVGSALGVDAYAVDTQAIDQGRTRSALEQAAAALLIDVSSASAKADLEKVARQFDIFAITHEQSNYDAALPALTDLLSAANVTQASFLAAYQSVLATYDANAAAHVHVVDTSVVTSIAATDGLQSGDTPVVSTLSQPPRSEPVTIDEVSRTPVGDGVTVPALSLADAQARYQHALATWGGAIFSFDPADANRNATSAADMFIYADNGAGNPIIDGFSAGSAAGHDVIDFSSAVFADWAHLLAASQQVSADTIITVDADSTITLKGVNLTSLTADDFSFG